MLLFGKPCHPIRKYPADTLRKQYAQQLVHSMI